MSEMEPRDADVQRHGHLFLAGESPASSAEPAALREATVTPRTKVAPVNAPRDFRIDELFFSTTNTKGIIASGNEVFGRVSGFPSSVMIGKPHNLIRHPDMPRVVFKVLWDYLLAGRPLAAYVKNMASDGRYYWVLALAAPIEGGYLSVRFKPSSPLFAAIEDAYKELRAIEETHMEQGEDAKTAMRASEARLFEILQAKGFADYAAFMRAMLYEELQSRDEILAREHRTMFAALPTRNSDEGPLAATLRAIHQQSLQAYGQINAVYAQLNTCAQLNAQLSTRSRTILELTRAFHLVSLNIAIKSSKLGDAGRALEVIATHLGEASGSVSDIVSSLTTQVATVSSWLGDTVFSLAWARLQFEMAIAYYREMLAASSDETSTESPAAQLTNVAALRFAFCQTIERAGQALGSLTTDLNGLSANTDGLGKAMLSLQVAHVGGLVEAARLTDDASFSDFLEDVRHHIDGTKDQLVAFADVIRDMGALAREAPVIMATVSKVADRMKHDEQLLGGVVATDPVVPATAA